MKNNLIKTLVVLFVLSLFITGCSKLRKFRCAYCGEKFTEIGYYHSETYNQYPSCKSKELTKEDKGSSMYYCSLKCCCECHPLNEGCN